jgi:hypothetical protein
LLVDRLELANFVGVIPPARWALVVEVPPDVIPAESANLLRNIEFMWLEKKGKEEKRAGEKGIYSPGTRTGTA